MTLESLKDPANEVDQESEAVAIGHYNFGNVILHQNGDLVRAEILVRESLLIRTRLYGNDHQYVGINIGLLANILSSQGNLGDEVEELYERCLAISVKHQGLEGSNTSISIHQLGPFHYKLTETHRTPDKRKEHLDLSEFYYKEHLRIETKLYGPAHPDAIEAASKLSIICQMLSEA
jgi:hypothetical protein